MIHEARQNIFPPLKICHPKRKGSCSNQHFPGELLSFGGVPVIIIPASCLQMKVYSDFPSKTVILLVLTGILGGPKDSEISNRQTKQLTVHQGLEGFRCFDICILLISFDHRFQFVTGWSSGLEVVFLVRKRKDKGSNLEGPGSSGVFQQNWMEYSSIAGIIKRGNQTCKCMVIVATLNMNLREKNAFAGHVLTPFLVPKKEKKRPQEVMNAMG